MSASRRDSSPSRARPISPAAAAALALVALVALSSTGCFKKKKSSGCERDSDCKGSRVCSDGNCQERARPAPPPPAPVPPPNPIGPNPGARPPGPPSNPNALAPDGYPVYIPPPGSPPPTNPEWDAVVREVTVAGSSALNCETKMVREWLRVVCRKRGVTVPMDVRGLHNDGQQSFVYKNPGSVVSSVVQVVHGKQYRALFTWDARGRRREAELFVVWPASAGRPSMYFGAER